MATLQWDHAVQFVNQPEAAIEIFAGQQLRAVAGGRHPGWGTRNALSYFGLTYIEFLAIADPDELRAATDKFLLSRDAARLLPENEALFRVALRSDDIDATYDQLRRTGVTVSPIVDGQRNDPQGNIIRWRIFTIYGDTDGLVYPFVLQWEEDDATRLTRLRARRIRWATLRLSRRCSRWSIRRRCAIAGRRCWAFRHWGSRDWTWAAGNLSSVKGLPTS